MLGDKAVLQLNVVYRQFIEHFNAHHALIGDSSTFEVSLGEDLLAGDPKGVDELCANNSFARREVTEEDRGVVPDVMELPLSAFEAFRSVVINRVRDNHRNAHGEFMGCDWDTVRDRIIQYGMADFTQSISALGSDGEPFLFSPEDRALLYAFANQRMHALSQIWLLYNQTECIANLSQGHDELCVLDIGCGPGTGLIALHSAMERGVIRQRNIRYIGVDPSRAMLQLADELQRSIRSVGITSEFIEKLDDASMLLDSRGPVLVLMSYLFANLDEQQAVEYAEYIRYFANRSHARVLGIIQNSIRDDRNISLGNFRRRLMQMDSSWVFSGESLSRVRYRSNLSVDRISEQQVRWSTFFNFSNGSL